MSRVLPFPFKIVFIYVEPILTLAGAYSAFVSPEWYLASQIPGPTVSGLLHTVETNMAIRLYGVVLALLATISLAVFPVVAGKSDPLSFSIARRLLFVLAVGDVVHVYTAALHIGEKALLDVKNWNDMTWGNIGITSFLLLSRVLWFLFVGLKKIEDGKKE